MSTTRYCTLINTPRFGAIPGTCLTRMTTIALAVSATTTSLGVAACSGWERGGTCVERVTYTALAVVIAGGVHLLPAVSQKQSSVARIAASALCAAGLLATLGGQMEFFALAQQHAGALRADTVPIAHELARPANPPARSLTVIAVDQEHARNAMAAIDDQPCHARCAEAREHHAELVVTLDELDTEAAEAKRREAADDRQVLLADRAMRLRDEMRVDPVTAQLAEVTGVAESRVSLLFSLVYSAVLDGIGVVAWLLVFAACRADDCKSIMPDTPHDVATVEPIANMEQSNCTALPMSDPSRDAKLMQLMQAVTDGTVPPTVAGIRKYLGCAQATAAKLRRELLAQRASTFLMDGEVA
jgi:hypothetical protein